MKRLENTLKKYLIKIMGTRWDVQSHEDQYSEGIPDLSFGINGVNGWIELKQIEKWPKKQITKVKPKKFTSEQINWINKREKKGGHCFILVKIEKEYFLFYPNWAKRIKEGLTETEYNSYCIAKWDKSINIDDFINIIAS